jgi:L-ascorbate metabolism protein UlaG (beta-lactamase superfamily)
MKIKWLGHASFLITSSNGKKVITDPYKSGGFGGAIKYGPIKERADVVTVSHSHDDHNDVGGLPGGFAEVSTTGRHEAGGLAVTGVKTFHDPQKGKERGRNIVFVIEMDGIRVVHLGDLGHKLSDDEIRAIGKADVLLIPVGGHFTIEPKDALAVARSLSPSVVIPMHYKTASVDFPIKPVDDFLSLAGDHERPGTSEIEIRKEDLGRQRVVVLEHAL